MADTGVSTVHERRALELLFTVLPAVILLPLNNLLSLGQQLILQRSRNFRAEQAPRPSDLLQLT